MMFFIILFVLILVLNMIKLLSWSLVSQHLRQVSDFWLWKSKQNFIRYLLYEIHNSKSVHFNIAYSYNTLFPIVY